MVASLVSAFISPLISLLAFGGARLVGPENFFKRTDFGEKNVAERAARLSVRPLIVRPRKIGHHLVGFNAKFFHRDLIGELALHIAWNGTA